MEAPATDDQRREAIILESKRIEYWARLWDEAYRRDAIRWRHVNSILVAAAGVLAAVAAGTGLASVTTRTFAGIMALSAAALSAFTSSLGAGARQSQCQTTAAADSTLADGARAFY